MSDKDELAKIEELQENIRQLEAAKESGALPVSAADAGIAALRKDLKTYQVELEGDGAIAQGDGAKAVGKNGILIEGSVYLGDAPEDTEKQLAIYRRMVMQNTSNLPLRGVDVGASDPSQAQKDIGLANVYVDLDTRTLVEQKRTSTEKEKQQGVEGIVSESIPLSVLQVVIQEQSLVLLGDPGGGKSTFVNFLAHCLAAHALEPEKGWLEHLNGWQVEDGDLLPIPVTLRDFARYFSEKIPAKAEPKHLWEFIRSRLEAQNLTFVADAIAKKLETGKAIVLLDGLDEVPTQAQRVFVRDAVGIFAKRYQRSRFLVTCRILSYQPPEMDKPDLRLTEMPTFEIARFDETKIKGFVEAWYAELARLGTIKGEEQKGLTARLAEAVQRPDLKRLAPNPLLLTVMALVHTHKGRLPDARALLYEETVDILLWRWEQIKLGGEDNAPRLRQYLLEAGRTDVDLKRVLWELAYRAHAMSEPSNNNDNLADITEHHIIKALAKLKIDITHPKGDLNWAQRLVELMKVRAGLLLERQRGIFTFPHRTFQEYLTGAHLASQTNFATETAVLAQNDTPHWREVALYAAGKLVYVNADVSKALSLVAELCPATTPKEDTSWHLAWLGGDILREIGIARSRDSELGRDLFTRAQTRLKDLLEGNHLSARERALAGDTLAALGDTRFDPAAWSLPKEENLGFIHIPSGEFIMGSDGFDDNEKPQHNVTLPDYWMAKYPVTVAQFRSFVEDANYTDFDKDALADPENRPVRYVTWYDALAYAEWLNEQLSGFSKQKNSQDAFWKGIAGGKLNVTLPSEAEWEKAACGTDGRIYPWENEFDKNKVNNHETGIGTTSAVGAFLSGASPYGLLDMSGNLWEWTRTILDPFKSSYPYKVDDGRETDFFSKFFSRALRGGAFNSPRYYVRCAYRGRGLPNYGNNDRGFRVVVVPNSSS